MKLQKSNLVYTLFVLMGLGVGLFSFPVLSHAANECNAQIVFDVNPKTIDANKPTTLSGTVNVSNLISNQGPAFNGYCWYPSSTGGADRVVKNLYVTIYDKNNGRLLKTDINLGLSGGNISSQTLNLPAWTFTPQDSSYTQGSMAVAALVKVTDGQGHWYNLTESAPVTVTVTAVRTPSGQQTQTTQQNDQQTAQTQATQQQQTQTTAAKVDCDKNRNDKDCLINPLPTDDLLDMLLRIVKGFLIILGGWSVAFIIIGGFRMVMSQGNSEAYEAAQKTITWAILGMVIALLSFSIVAIVQNLLGASVKPI